MNALELAVKEALESLGSNQQANKAYLEFIKANFIIPIDKNSAPDDPEVLYLKIDKQYFLPVFSNYDYFSLWTNEISEAVLVLELSGVDLLKGIGEHVTVCLNIGSAIYKEFNTAEIARMRSMVLKIFQ